MTSIRSIGHIFAPTSLARQIRGIFAPGLSHPTHDPAARRPLRQTHHPVRPRRATFAMEAMEPRMLLSADVSFIDGQRHDNEDAVVSVLQEQGASPQIFYVSLAGAQDLAYDGPVTVEDIDLPAFSAPGALEGQERAILDAMMDSLDVLFDDDAGVDFTLDRPDGGEFSTVYVGGDAHWFAQWGDYLGLAEQLDTGNRDHGDDAFVFSAALDAAGLNAAQYGVRLATVVAHEAGHLLGQGHAQDEGPGPLAGVAFDPKVHVSIGTDAADDAVDDGKVTIGGVEYAVHPLIVGALNTQRAFFNAGAVAGDGFPDVLMGQFAIHPIDHATWLTRVLDMAWKAQTDASYSATERSQILAWSYGFLTHSAGDHWAHTLVNSFAEGVAPGFGAAATSIPGDQRDLGNMLRHFMTEAYIADSLQGFDGNRTDRTLVPGSLTDFSDDVTPSIAYDAPVRFIYETFLRAFPNDPTHVVDMGWGKGTLTVDAATNTFTRGDVGLLLDGFEHDGFKVGQKITVAGFSNAANNGTFYVTAVSKTQLTVSGPLANETASGDETIFVAVAKTAPITVTASAIDNTFTRSDPGGSFVTDGFFAGMRFDALGMTANHKTYIVKTVTATQITVVGGIASGAGEVSELANEAAVANVQLVGIGQRGPGLDNIFKLRDTVFEKAVEKGARGDANELATLAADVIQDLIDGTAITTQLKDDLFRAYLYNWVEEIDEGVRHWAEFGLAFTKAFFDAGSRRELQEKVGAETGFADSADKDSIRSKAEDGVGIIDVLIAELEDPDGNGSTFDSFINRHLLPMAGLPAELGLLRAALQGFASEVDTLLQPLDVALNPLKAVLNDAKTYVTDFLKEQIEKRTGLTFGAIDYLKQLGNKMDIASITLPGGAVVPLFKPGDHERLDALLGLPANHHTGPITQSTIATLDHVFKFYAGAQDFLLPGATMNKTTFAAYANAVTLTKLLLLMEDDPMTAGASSADDQLSEVFGDLIGNAGYDFGLMNLNGAHGGNVLTATLPGVANGEIWMTSIDADQIWRQDNYTVSNALFRIAQTGSPTSLIEYEASGLTPGDTYKIFVSWQQNVTQKLDNLTNSDFPDQFISPTKHAQYTVTHGGSTVTFQEDQSNFANDIDDGGLGFEQLGADASVTFTVDALGKLKVTLSNVTGSGVNHVVAGPVLFQKTSDLSFFRIQNNRDPTTLAPVATPNRTYTETVPNVWIDLKYDGGNGNDPLWESALLRPAFRTLFADWANGGLDFPDLGDATSPDPNTVVIAKSEIASHATPFGPVVPDNQLDVPIPEVLEDAILAGLQGLVDFANAIEGTAPMQVKIPGIDKSLAELIDLSAAVNTHVRQPIVGYFATDGNDVPGGTPTFRELFEIISPSLGTWNPGDGSAFEFDLDLRALFAAEDVPLSLSDGDAGFGLEVDGTLDVGASAAFLDTAGLLPRFAFGLELADSVPASDRFYIRAETLRLHAEAHAANLNFGARLGFLSVGVSNGSIDFDADVDFDLSVLDADDDDKITLAEITANFGDLDPDTGGTLAGTLPITASLAGLTLPANPEVLFGATDIFDLDTYFFDFSGIGPEALNFGNLDAAGMVSLIARLADELDNVRDSGFFDKIDIPLVDGAVDSVLDFADVISRELLFDKGADDVKDGPNRLATDINAALAAAGLDTVVVAQGMNGTQVRLDVIDRTVTSIAVAAGTGDLAGAFAQWNFAAASDNASPLQLLANVADNGRFTIDSKLKITLQRSGQPAQVVDISLAAATTADNISAGDDVVKLVRADNSATFDTVQGMIARLVAILGAGSVVGYDGTTDALTINLGALLPKLDFDKDFDLDFALPLGPLVNIQTDTQINVSASVGFDTGFTLGVYLGNTVPGALSDLSDGTESGGTPTPLANLNDGAGVDIKTDPAFMAPQAVISAIRQLTGDASFEISFGNDTVQSTASALGTATALHDATQNFLGDGKVKVGDTVFNLTDGSSAKVITVANGLLTTAALTGGQDNVWAAGDQYRTAHLVTVGTLIGQPGTDINASKASGSQREVTITVNPINSKNIIIAPNNVPGIRGMNEVQGDGIDNDLDGQIDEPAISRDSVWVTFNGGQTWEQKVIPVPVGAQGSHGDPAIAFSRDGSTVVYIHMVEKNLLPAGPEQHVMASAVSHDGGATWNVADTGVLSLTGTVIGDEDGDTLIDDADKDFIAVGPNPDDLSQDLFVVTWHRERVIYASTSTDGIAWNDPVVVGSVERTDPASPVGAAVPRARGTGIDAIPTFGSNGEIFVVWEEYPAAGVGRIMFDMSLDGGKTWGAGHDIKVFYDTAESAVADLSLEDRNKLDAFAAMLKADSHLVATVAGFTDRAGTTVDNQALAEARALAVFNYLTVTKTVSATQVRRVAFGETVSWLAEQTADGVANAANRRVELWLDRIVYTGNVNAFNDPFNTGAGGTGLDGTDTDYEIPAQPERGIWFGLSVDVDNSDGPNRGRIYVSFVDQADLDGNADGGNAFDHHDTEVFVIASDDDGVNWNALFDSPDIAVSATNPGVSLVRVNDFNDGGASQFFAWLDVDDATGNLAVGWYDTRNDDGSATGGQLNNVANDEVEYFAAISTSGGLTWSDDIQVSDSFSSAFLSDDIHYGDYTGIAFQDDMLHLAWADNSNTLGNPGPVTAAGQRHTDAFYDSIRLSNLTIDDLVDDINDAIAALSALAGKVIAVNDGNRLSLKSVDPTKGFTLAAVQGDPAVKDLGFSTAQSSSGPLVGDPLNTFVLQGGDARFTLTVAGTDYAVTVTKLSTTGNTTIDELVANVNTALLAALPAALDGKIVAIKSGTSLVLRIADAGIAEVGFSSAIDDPAVLELGLTDDATITQPAIRAVKEVGVVVGRLPQDTTLTIATTGGPTGSVTLFADDTASNTTILSLVNDLNKVLATPTLKTGVLTTFAFGSNASFSVKIDSGAFVPVTVTGLADNETLADLVEDINAALETAGLDGSVRAKSSGTDSNPGNARVKFEALEGVSRLEITAAAGNALQLPTAASATRFADEIVADSSGNRLVLSVAAGSGVTAFTVAADAAGAALGLAAGPTAADNVDFEIRVSNPAAPGDVVRVTLTGVSNIAQVIAAIEAAAPDVEVVINESKTGLTLIDHTFNLNGTNARTFSVVPVNGSAAATGLGIAGVDATEENERDGHIDGGPIIGIKLTDRFFLQNATLEATLDISVNPLSAGASFGFVGVEIGGEASLSAELSLGLVDPTASGPGHDGKISLSEIIKHLSTPGDLFDASFGGNGGVELTVDVTGLPFIDLPDPGTPGAPKVTIDVLNLGDPFNDFPDVVDLSAATIARAPDGKSFTLSGNFTDRITAGARVNVGSFETFASEVTHAAGVTTVKISPDDVLPGSIATLAIGTPIAPAIDFRFENLEELVAFDNLDFDFGSIIDALLMVRDLLTNIEGADTLLNEKIPLVDVSVNDLLDFANDFSDALTAAQNNPSGSLQLLDQAISEAFGVPAASDLIEFTLDNFGTPTNFDDDIIKIGLNLAAGFNRSLNVSIPDLNLPEPFAGAVDFGGAATLSAEGNAAFTLDIGVGLNNPTQLYLYNTSGLHADLALAGEDMAFKAGLGPLSLSIIDGEASIAGDVDVQFATGLFTNGRRLVNVDNIGELFAGLSVDFDAPIYASLPVYFPTESRHVGDITLRGDLLYLGHTDPFFVQTAADVPKSEGTVTSATANTLTDTAADFAADAVANGQVVHIVAGMGVGQSRAITGVNTSTDTLTVNADWAITPDATSEYLVVQLAGGPAENGTALTTDDKIVLDVSQILGGLADGLENLSLLDQVLFIVDGVDVVLGGVQDVMDGEVLGFSLPIIGDKLAGAADVVGDFRSGFLNDFRNEVEKLADPSQNGIADILLRLLGPSGLDVLIATTDKVVIDNGIAAGATANTLIGAFGSFAAGALRGQVVTIVSGAGAGQTRTIVDNNGNTLTLDEDWATAPTAGSLFDLIDRAGNAVKNNGKFVDGTLADITSFNNLGFVDSVGDAEIWWKVKIGQNLVDAGADIGFDVGLPGLGLKTEGEISLNIDWELDLGFGLSGKDGFFLFVADDDELLLTASVDFEAGLTGTLGFLEFTAEDTTIDGKDTHVAASFGVDIFNDGNPTDDRLGLSELGRMGFDVGVQADATVALAMTLGIAGDDGGFPQIQADFFLDWAIGTPENPISLFDNNDDFDFGSSIQDGLKVVEFRDVALDAGSYISDVVGPLVKKVQQVTEPVQPIIDIVTTPLPVLSDLGLDITLLDIAEMTGAVNPAFITAVETIADVVTLINSIELPEGGALLIPIGDFTIFEDTPEFASLMGSAGITNFDLGSASFDVGKFNEAVFGEGGLLADLLGQELADSLVGEVAGIAGEVLSGLAEGTGAGGGEKAFRFDLLEDPSQIFGLLMGEEATLVSFDMPKFDFEAEFSAFFSIFGPLGVSINLEAALSIDFMFGYDTKGFRDFAASDFRNPLLLADGLYVDDDPSREDLPGEEEDPPELTFDGGLWAAAELNLGIARGGVGGGIFIGVDFNLFDNDGDGKIRLDELATNFSNQLKAPEEVERLLAPLAIFDVTGKITAELFAFLKIDFGLFELDKKFNITPPVTLADFDVDFFRPPVLATELDNGDLILNMGTFAAQRNLGDTSDFGEHFVVESAGANRVAVWAPGLEDAGADAKQFYSVTGRIIAAGGLGDDTIDLSGVDASIAFDLEGGEGVDTIKGGAGGGIIRGGLGNDILTGGTGADLIFGNAGGDIIDAKGGVDIVIGDEGEVTDGLVSMVNRKGFVRGLVSATDGADSITGGADDDIVIGGGAADLLLDGDAGNDIVIGDGGLVSYASPAVVSDTDGPGFGDLMIAGGDGDDWLYGGQGNDLIHGDNADGTGSGNDVAFGGAGRDTMHGDDGNDVLFGDGGFFKFGDPTKPAVTPGGEADSIFGGLGQDTLLGGGGSDTIHGDKGAAGVGDADLILGGVGMDILHGDGGDDVIYGETDPDTLFGDDGADHLEGGHGNDVAWGGAGQDLLVAGFGSDTLDGQTGDDTYRITARGGNITDLTIAYDGGGVADADQLVLIGTSEADTVLLRGMADFYFPTLLKLVGKDNAVPANVVEGLTDTIFDSEEPDKLRAVLQVLEDAYGPHTIPAGLVDQIIDLYTAAVKSGLLVAVANNHGPDIAGQPTTAQVQKIIYDDKGTPDTADDTGILTTSSGLFPGKLDEIRKTITEAYGNNAVPPLLLDAIATAWDNVGTPLKNAIEQAITNAYVTEAVALGSDTDTGFVALINNGGANVERFNYRNIEGITVNTLSGNDYVVIDDVLAPTTINLGIGEDRVQVGQVFRSERVKDFDDVPAITGITAEDVFTTLEITRGWLSNGVSEATTVNGGDGADQFMVFHNIAVLNLNGGDGDDVFTVRAFALRGSSDNERARTDMKGDGGADTILYVMNAPVGIDGGDGFDTVRIVGTEFADDFVVTDAGIFGAGLNVNYVNIEKIVADGAEGDDRFFVQSTGIDIVTEIDGGLGSDTFFVGGNPSNAPVAVVSNDFRGHSGIILHSIEAGSDPTWLGAPIEGISANVGDNEESMVLITESLGSSRVIEGNTTGGAGAAFDGYGVRLSRAPTGTVRVRVVLAGMSPEDEAKGYRDLQFYDETTNPNGPDTALLGFHPKTGAPLGPLLEFNAGNWQTTQYVYFKAIDDGASEGPRFVFINHSLKDTDASDPNYRAAKTLSVKVQVQDNDRDGIIVTPSGRDNVVLEDGATYSGFGDSFTVALTRAPSAPVTVNLTALNGQVTLSTTVLKFDNDDDADASDGVLWSTARTVNITAPNDVVVEGLHTDFIRFSVTSADVEEDLPSGGGAAGTAPVFVAIDGDFDLLGLQPEIPDTKPTSYVLLPHRPLAGTVVVTIDGVQLADGTVDGDPVAPGINFNPAVPLSGPARFEVTGNTLTFLSASGAGELRTGIVQVKYLYREAGYDGTFVKDGAVDVYDEDTPMVILQTVDDGSVDVIEGSGITDKYTVRLSQQPTGNVTVKIDAVDTRTTYGRTARFQEQVTVNNASFTTLTFTPANFATPQDVIVRPVNDTVRDGNDTQVFAPDLQTVNKIRGPLIIEGAAGAGSLSLPEPLMLPHELNILVPDGTVQGFTPGAGEGAIETMRVSKSELLKVIEDMNKEDASVTLGSLDELKDKTLQIASGPGTGVVLNPLDPKNLYDRFWQILALTPLTGADADKVELKLLNPSIVDPAVIGVPAQPVAGTTKYAITSLSLNFFAKESEQVDYLFMYDDQSVGNDSGALTSADGVVRAFDAATSQMQVETAALQAVINLAGLNDIQALINRRLEISIGDGLGRSWRIAGINGTGDVRTLTLDQAQGGGANPNVFSEFRIAGGDTRGRITGFGMGPNILVNGRPQPGALSYGDIEVVQVSLGRGNDTVRVDYATNSEDHTTKRTSDFQTLTLLDTGAGNDIVTVNLQDGDDGAFSLNLNTGNDQANAGASTLPLVIFGWDGNDTITAGSGDDIVFGDRGRVDYVDSVLTDHDKNPATPPVGVDTVVTRLGHSVAPNPVNPPVNSATLTTLTDSTANFATTFGGLVGLSVQAISPEGHEQFRTIVANTATTITIDRPWDQIPIGNPPQLPVPKNNYYYRISAFPEDQTDGIARDARLVWSIDDAVGGIDTINAGAGNDLVIAGAGNDVVNAGAGNDRVAGDGARFEFVPVLADPALDDGNTRLAVVFDKGVAGNDTLNGDAGRDLLIGGLGDDTINGGAEADVLIGDSARLLFDATETLVSIDTIDIADLAPADPAAGGVDTIRGGADDDLLIGGALGDKLDGGAEEDLIFGDNVTLTLSAGSGAAVLPRFVSLTGATLTYDAAGVPNIATHFNRPGGNPGWADWQITLDQSLVVSDRFGNDSIAGGAQDDMIFGQRGNDTIQGDGSITLTVGIGTDATGALTITPSVEDFAGAGSDGDDYIEGNDGADLVFGNLGQDDIIGGNSSLFSLLTYPVRGDVGRDVLFGGAGTRVSRNNEGAAANQHGRDADVIASDNANIYRLVNASGLELRFNYDGVASLYDLANRIDPRAVQLLDYTPGGPDFTTAVEGVPLEVAINPGTGLRDQGQADEVHGEGGDDAIYGMVGNDALYGDQHDDIVIGGYGDDWISGGTGDDGILGDDGRLLVSRNTTQGEILYGVAGIPVADQNRTVSAMNNIQFGIINVSGALKYTADLEPDNLDPAAAKNVLFRPLFADDIIYGGLGSDSIHGGAGDDAISGAEAMAESYANNYGPTGTKLNTQAIRSDFLHPVNPGNVLGYQTTGVNATKFAFFDVPNALNKILIKQSDGSLVANGGSEWLLNFANEGPNDTKWIVGTGFANQPKPTDGDDHIFGDLGNDWLVGGSGRDTMWAGWGDDLMNGDDLLSTSGTTDTNPSYEDLMYGGAGRDVMLINTNGDRAIDWVGEFNSYYTPFAQFGMASVLRLIQPDVPQYLLDLSKSQGADQTLAAKYGGAAARNGEPFGELGMVLQQDAAFGAQSGSPRDAQAGNSKGKVDVNVSAGNQPIYLRADSAGEGGDVLDAIQLAPVLEAARDFWAQILGGDPRLALLDAVDVQIGNLEGDQLALTLHGTIYIDADAAGHGWFVDASPMNSSEYLVMDGVLVASAGAAAGRMDLLSVLAHELGHVAGLSHADGGVMDEELAFGTRTLLGVETIDLTGPGQGPAPTLIWDTPPVAAAALVHAAPAAAPIWIDDFLNHRGRSEQERNPNASLRVSVPVAMKPATHLKPELGASSRHSGTR
jgi:Ca2+-binding RTX toxin-like protein